MKEALSFVQKTVSRRSVLRRYKRSIASWGNSLTNDIERTLSLSLLTGEGVDQGIDAIAACDDTFKDARWKAERIWRTETADVYESSKLDTAEYLNSEEDLSLKKQLTAIIDYRTGEDSIYVNGQVRELKKPFNDGKKDYMSPPNRPNDRETVTYLEEDWLEEEREKLEADLSAVDSNDEKTLFSQDKPVVVKKGKAGKTAEKIPKAPASKYLYDYQEGTPSEKNIKQIVSNEQKTSLKGIEHGYGYDSTGKKLFSKKGTKKRIRLNKKEVKKLKHGIFSHNHPQIEETFFAHTSFSVQDIESACEIELQEIRVVSGNKTFSMKPPKGKMWTKNYFEKEIKPLYDHYEVEVDSNMMDAMLNNPNKYWSDSVDEIWNRVAKKSGMRYSSIIGGK